MGQLVKEGNMTVIILTSEDGFTSLITCIAIHSLFDICTFIIPYIISLFM